MTIPTVGKWWAELHQDSAIRKIPGRLKWGDIVLKRGVADVPPSSLLTLRAGQSFTLSVPRSATDAGALSALSDAAARRAPMDLSMAENRPGAASSRVTKIEALTIKQKVTQNGAVIDIELRKL